MEEVQKAELQSSLSYHLLLLDFHHHHKAPNPSNFDSMGRIRFCLLQSPKFGINYDKKHLFDWNEEYITLHHQEDNSRYSGK